MAATHIHETSELTQVKESASSQLHIQLRLRSGHTGLRRAFKKDEIARHNSSDGPADSAMITLTNAQEESPVLQATSSDKRVLCGVLVDINSVSSELKRATAAFYS